MPEVAGSADEGLAAAVGQHRLGVRQGWAGAQQLVLIGLPAARRASRWKAEQPAALPHRGHRAAQPDSQVTRRRGRIADQGVLPVLPAAAGLARGAASRQPAAR